MERFKNLGLSEPLLRALHELGFQEPREIQEKTIPLALAGKDVIGGSATGSGKTLAFGASIIEHVVPGQGVQALILTPTRELAEQVAESLGLFSKHKHLKVCAIYGGVALSPQMRALERSEIVVGTPGRILDHLERRTLRLDKVKTLVLDEADRMLDMGFIDDVEKIIRQCPKQRQTLLFSATISSDINHIAHKHMNRPEHVAVESYVDASKLKQIYYDVPQDMKFSLLLHLLKHEHSGLIMVFCNTQRTTDFVANHLQQFGIDAVAIHGGLTQAKRNKIMEHFHAGKVTVLICTDVAARGLDIKNVSHIYNYDLSPNSKEYIHRIGRTARAGKEGIAVNIVAPRDYENFRAILRDDALHINQEALPTVERVQIQFARGQAEEGGRRFSSRPPSRGRFGSRGGGGGGGYRREGGQSRSGGGDRGRFGGRSDSRPDSRRSFGGGQGGHRRPSSSGSSRGRRFSPRPRRY